MAKKSFTTEDLKRWWQKGLISDEQLIDILAEEGLKLEPGAKEKKAGLKIEPEAEEEKVALELEPEVEEKKTGLNLVTVAYYFGGLLAFFSLAFFTGMNWEGLGDGGRLAVALSAMIVIGALGVWLRFLQGYRTAGGLLLFIATAVLPLFIYTVEQLLGFDFDAGSAMAICLIGLAGALAVLWLTRFSLISLLVAALVHAAIMDILWMGGWGGDLPLQLTAATCGAFILLGIALTFWGSKGNAFWFKLYGLVGLYIASTSLFMTSDSVLLGLLFLIVYLVLVAFSLRFREVIYLIFGAIGVYTYIVRLVFDTFEGTVYFPLLLGGIGISIIVLAVFAQRYSRRS